MPRRLLPFLLSIALWLALPANPSFAQVEGPIYVVQPGDTLSEIARTFGTSVAELVQANGLSAATPIQPGQELLVPGYEGVVGVLTSHRIELGDSLDWLAWAYRAEPEALARLNRVVRPNRLFVGQSLIVPAADDGEAALRSGHGVLIVGNEGAVYRAARDGSNPWELSLEAPGGPRRWLVPGELVPQSGDSEDFRPWPGAVNGVSITPAPAAQGATLAVTFEGDPGMAVAGRLGERNLNFMSGGQGDFFALQGIHAMSEPGLYEFEVVITTPDGGHYGHQQPFPIRAGDYGFDPVLIVPKETVDPENTAPEDQMVAELVASATPEKLWRGSFAFPSNYFTESFPSVFGTRRNYNNTGYDAYHTGLDFYGGVGVEIVAPAPGRVVLADALTVRGNTTIIDHGWGVYSLFFHQSEFLVSEGDQVETGQVIGLVGATGRVTGAHLHWEIQVGGVPVQPLDWVEGAFPPASAD